MQSVQSIRSNIANHLHSACSDDFGIDDLSPAAESEAIVVHP